MRYRRKPELPKSVAADHGVRPRPLAKQPLSQSFGLAEGAQVPASDLFSNETQAFPRDAVLELVGEEAIVSGSEHSGRHAGPSEQLVRGRKQ